MSLVDTWRQHLYIKSANITEDQHLSFKLLIGSDGSPLADTPEDNKSLTSHLHEGISFTGQLAKVGLVWCLETSEELTMMNFTCSETSSKSVERWNAPCPYNGPPTPTEGA